MSSYKNYLHILVINNIQEISIHLLLLQNQFTTSNLEKQFWKNYDYSFETQNVSCPLFIFRQSITNDKRKRRQNSRGSYK